MLVNIDLMFRRQHLMDIVVVVVDEDVYEGLRSILSASFSSWRALLLSFSSSVLP